MCSATKTSRCTARWPLRHAALPVITDKYHKTEALAICVEWSVAHFGPCLTINRSTSDEVMCEKQFFTYSFPVTLTFDLY